MSAAPDAAACILYAGPVAASWGTNGAARVDQALAAEKAAQAKRCRVPADGQDWPADLAEALMRRVLRNLTMRGVALGVQAVGDNGGIRIGSTDPEIRRLEAPYRRVIVA